jgi:hypothetical protein
LRDAAASQSSPNSQNNIAGAPCLKNWFTNLIFVCSTVLKFLYWFS